nr:DNA mismatch repair endonuclease MutL [uncultured Acetatifactor sp.]
MSQIHILDSETIDKIAAGEVVERPSSVVKELVENAIDAGASAVTVEAKDGGIEFIRVTDNGCGMEGSQLRTAFLRHATSKIEDASDLVRISSLGFRGEALSSIAAVAKVEVITTPAGSITGTRILLEGAKEVGFEEVGAPEGTTFLVRNLFFNTPVRRKFLKQPATEGGYIADLMEHLALSRPDVSFKLVLGGQTKFHTSGNGDLKEVIYRIYGRDAAGALVPIQAQRDGARIEGYLGKPVQVRSNRNFEIYFINGRFIRSNVVARAIEEGYKEYLMQHKFPFCVLHITMDAGQVDVNVHPTKMDVRFSDAISFSNFLAESVRGALQSREMIPEALLSTERELREARKEEKKELEKKSTPEPFEHKRSQAYQVMEEARYNASQTKGKEFARNPVWERVKGHSAAPLNMTKNQEAALAELSGKGDAVPAGVLESGVTVPAGLPESGETVLSDLPGRVGTMSSGLSEAGGVATGLPGNGVMPAGLPESGEAALSDLPGRVGAMSSGLSEAGGVVSTGLPGSGAMPMDLPESGEAVLSDMPGSVGSVPSGLSEARDSGAFRLPEDGAAACVSPAEQGDNASVTEAEQGVSGAWTETGTALSQGSIAEAEQRISERTSEEPIEEEPFFTETSELPEDKGDTGSGKLPESINLPENAEYAEYGKASSPQSVIPDQSYTGEQMNLFEEKILTMENRSRFRTIGQVFDTYWLIEFEDKLMMIDQHAAHEKVNYERLIKRYREKNVLSQGLMPPVIVSLSGQEESVLKTHLDTFAALGFEIEAFGGSEYALRSVPVDLYGCDEREMFLEVLDSLLDGTGFGSIRVIEEKIASMSCKAAVKGNNKLSVPEAEALIDELLTLDNPYNCPHGRPTIVTMSKTEMERKFKRIVN